MVKFAIIIVTMLPLGGCCCKCCCDHWRTEAQIQREEAIAHGGLAVVHYPGAETVRPAP